MEFRVLGPVEMRVGGQRVNVGHARQRALLAVLLFELNRVVPAERLIDRVWGEAPPASVRNVVYGLVARLRAAIANASQPGLELSRRAAGYIIEADPELLDLYRFRQQAALATTARADEDASAHLRSALSNWHGEALTGVSSAWLGSMRHTLEQLRTAAILELNDIALRRGQHQSLIAELTELSSAHETNERAAGQLMLALYRAGQPAEALRWFEQTRRQLADQFGANPGTKLQELHQRILRNDPALTQPQQQPARSSAAVSLVVPAEVATNVPAFACRDGELPAAAELAAVVIPAVSETAGVERASQPVASAGPSRTAGPATGKQDGAAVPRQLPAAVASFAGRDAELTALTALLGPGSGGAAQALVISAIRGTAGVGKTALAVKWAHQIASRFPDGQLYVNLRGFDPDEPVAAADALAGLLRSLGVRGADIPDGVEDRERLYRSRLAGRRVLVVLDNARDGEQVRPLLPGDPGCVAVVTSRDSLSGLVAADGARRLDLDVLPPADAIALLRSLIGARADDDPGAAAELAALCARLPLALRLAAVLAAARLSAPLAELVAELETDRLDGLDAGEDRADVRAVFSWSVKHLPDDAVTAYALIGLHPGDDLDLYAAAALTGTTTIQARRVLERLHRASLLQAAGPGRYGMHDLLRAYAREQAAARDPGDQCDQALTRLFDYYLAAAAAAMDVLFPAEAHQRPRIAATAAVLPEMADEARARAWLDTERANLVAVVVHCAGHDRPEYVTGLAGTLFRYLITGSHLPEADTIYDHALQAARRCGDLAAEAGALNGLGGIGLVKGRFRDAASHYQAALERHRRRGDRKGEARVLHNLGVSDYHLHNHDAATGNYRQAIAAYEQAGDDLGAARAVTDLASAEIELGSYDQAAEHLQHALAVFREAKDEVYEAEALGRLGDLSCRRGQLTQAAEVYEQALALYRDLDYPAGVADELSNLGEVSVRRGEYQKAISYLRQALALLRDSGSQHGETHTLLTLAEALQGAGQPAAARAELETALCLAADTGNTYQEASAHRSLAENYHSGGETGRARHHWQQALDLYTQLGAPEADWVRSRLSVQEATAQN
jgi:DNA-binding SARP family transcriptional activator/tetratricopeptide (TPR) repeat protein